MSSAKWRPFCLSFNVLTHWGRAMHICVSKLTIIASDNGLSPGRRQTIIWNNAGILSIGFLGTNFSEILIEILTFSFKKMPLKVSSAKWRPFCLGLNVLKQKLSELWFNFLGGGSLFAVHSECEYYDFSTDQWLTAASMTMRRSRAGVTVAHGKLYAIGGWVHMKLSLFFVYVPYILCWIDYFVV